MRLIAMLVCLATGSLAAQTSLQVDSSWLTMDSAARKAEFSLVAGLTTANGNMNFDGASAGGLTLTVPAKWTVVLHFKNNDAVLQHSVMVIASTNPVPMSGATPAIPHAATHQPEQGLPAGGREDVQFTAERPGSYLVYCGVPGHGAAGMWIHLEVSATAHRPGVTATPPKAP